MTPFFLTEPAFLTSPQTFMVIGFTDSGNKTYACSLVDYYNLKMKDSDIVVLVKLPKKIPFFMPGSGVIQSFDVNLPF